MTEIRKFFEQEFYKVFKQRDLHAIRGMLDEAYILNNELYSRNTFLQETEIGRKDVRAHILRAAIAKVAKLYCSKGILPYTFATPSNSIGNCRHIELKFRNNTLFIARVDYPGSVPCKAQYRPTVPDIEYDLFDQNQKPLSCDEQSIDVFLATYGDVDRESFRFGDIGILGEGSWLFSMPLKQGVYRYSEKKESEMLLVELTEDAEKEIREDEQNEKGAAQ